MLYKTTLTIALILIPLTINVLLIKSMPKCFAKNFCYFLLVISLGFSLGSLHNLWN